MICVTTKKINWEGPEPLVSRFDAQVTGQFDRKKKWIGATAAMIAYMCLPEKERRHYDTLAMATRTDHGLKAAQDAINSAQPKAPPLAASKAGGTTKQPVKRRRTLHLDMPDKNKADEK